MNTREVKLIILSILLYAGLNFGHPVTPAFLDDLNISDSYFGILFSTMALALMLFSPFWGNKGDNYGRRTVLAIGVFGYGIGQLFFGYGTSVPVILFGRAVAGTFAAAIFSNNIAAFSEISNDRTRARNMAIVFSIAIFAQAIGYYIGGKLGDLTSPATTIVIQGFYDIVIAILIFIFYPSTTIKAVKRKSFIHNIKHVKDIDSQIIYFLITVTFWSLARNNVAKFLDVYLNNNGFSTSEIGSYIMITGIIGGVTSLILVPYLAKKFDLLKSLVVTLVLMIILLVVTFTIKNVVIAMYVTYLGYVILNSVYASLDQTFISKNTLSNYGTVIGVRESFKSIGLVSGPLLITLLFDQTNKYVFYFNALIYVISLGFLLIFVYRRYHERKSKVS